MVSFFFSTILFGTFVEEDKRNEKKGYSEAKPEKHEENPKSKSNF